MRDRDESVDPLVDPIEDESPRKRRRRSPSTEDDEPDEKEVAIGRMKIIVGCLITITVFVVIQFLASMLFFLLLMEKLKKPTFFN